MLGNAMQTKTKMKILLYSNIFKRNIKNSSDHQYFFYNYYKFFLESEKRYKYPKNIIKRYVI